MDRPWWLVVLPSLLSGAGVAMAQPADTLVYPVPGVVVEALRGKDSLHTIPAASFVITREAIRRSGAARVSSLLQTLPGLHGYLQNASGDPTVVDPRGFTANGESSYLKVLLNGQDVRDVENGNVDWDWVLPDDVERLEIVEGPGSWVWGDAAEGGIVNIVTPAPGTGFQSDATLRVGSFGVGAGSIVLSGGRPGLAGTMRQAVRYADGWRDHSRERVYAPGVEGRWTQGEVRVSADAAWLDADRHDPGSLTPAQIAADRGQSETDTDFTHARRLLLGARVARGNPDVSEWSLAPYYRRESVEQVRTISNLGLSWTKSHPTRSWTVGGELSWRGRARVAGRSIALLAGMEVEQAQLDSRYHDFDAGTEGALRADVESWRTFHAAFASAQVPLTASTTARLGFRHDWARVESDTTRRTPRAGSPFVSLIQQIGGSASVHASYGAAFRIPTLNQLFDRWPFDITIPGVGVITSHISNPLLDPQRAHSFEVGGRLDGANGATAALSAYWIDVRDEIDFDTGTFTYANIGKSRHRGVQGAVVVPIVTVLTARAGGTWSPTTIEGGPNDGNQINAVPLGTATGSLILNLPRQVSIETAVRYVGRQYLEKENLHPLPDYTVFDLVAGVRLGRVHGTARIGNLFDREYSDTGYWIGEERLYPAAGRSFTLAATFD
jgi:outer membrane receptor protein involved in Fe transport